MKITKLVLSLLVASSFFLPVGDAQAAGKKATESTENPITLSNKELKKLRDSGEDYDVWVTYEQAVERTAEITGQSVEEVMENNPNTCSQESTQETSNSLVSAASVAPPCYWHETATAIAVKTINPQLVVILAACRDGSFGWVDTNTQPMLQEFKASTTGSKYFSGTIKVDLESDGYHYVVNGYFYNSTTTTHSGTTGANTVWTATYTVSSTTNMYGSVYTGLKWRQVVY